MERLLLSPRLEDKIFEISYSGGAASRVTSYFPLSKSEVQEVFAAAGSRPEMRSIFTDSVSDEEWAQNREKIKKKFNDDLIGIGPHNRH